MKITIRKTFKYRVYRCDKRDKYLHRRIDRAGQIWNHCLALQRRFYRLTGKYIQPNRMKSHIAKLRRQVARFEHWQLLGSQVVQDVAERQDRAYQRFFRGLAKRPPKFKKVKKYSSITYKQAGWKLRADTNVHETGGKQGGKKHIKSTGHLVIEGVEYKFVKHRELEGKIKTITMKRDSCNRLFVCFSVECEIDMPERVMTGETAGLDFGLQTFLTDDNGNAYKSPEFLKQELGRIKQLSRAFSHKQRGSKAHKRAQYALSRAQIRVSDKRTDSHYKLAHQLCDTFDTIYLEDLNLQGMKRLWGRKVSDLAFGEFVTILKWIGKKRGVELVFIDRYEPSSKTCSHCGSIQKLTLNDRVYACHRCGLVLDRDHNAARNIKRIGASIRLPEACQTGACTCLVVDGRSSLF